MSHIEIFDSRYARLKAVDWDFTDASQDSLASIHPKRIGIDFRGTV